MFSINHRLVLIIGLLLIAITSAATPTVSNVTAKQRYPWNGMVDINCTVSGISGTTNRLVFAVAAVNSGIVHDISQFWVVKNGTNSADRAVHTNGTYHLVWDSKADFDNQICSNMVMRVNLVDFHDKVQLWVNGPYWATTNIGAEEPWESGYYFWWGDTIGYKRVNDAWESSDGSSSNFSFDSSNISTYNKSINTLQSEGWITRDNVLAPGHDAAHVQWGGGWRMPTQQEVDDLNENCDWTWATWNGVSGYIVRGRGAYSSASIFLPAAGYGIGTSLYSAGSSGDYFSSVPISYYYLDTWTLYFTSQSHGTSYGSDRLGGQPVRPVQGFIGTNETNHTSSVTISFNANGGTTSVTSQTYIQYDTYGSLPIATRTGYMFAGWFTAASGGELVMTFSVVPAVDTTLYAHWTVIAPDSHDKVQLWEGGPHWATTNIGADEPWEYGYYFWWGGTIGYKCVNGIWVTSNGSSGNFSFDSGNTPTDNKSIDTLQSEGWITADGVLAPEHDAAQVQWGGSWRMPTQQELDDLNSNCDWTWSTTNGVNGYVVHGRGTYANASIFLPAAGYGYETVLDYAGSRGLYRSSVPYLDSYYSAWDLDFHWSGDHGTGDAGGRCYGQSVRPVQGFTQ